MKQKLDSDRTFVVDEIGRWSSTYKALKRLIFLRPAIEIFGEDESHTFFSTNDYEDMQNYIDLLVIFKEATSQSNMENAK